MPNGNIEELATLNQVAGVFEATSPVKRQQTLDVIVAPRCQQGMRYPQQGQESIEHLSHHSVSSCTSYDQYWDRMSGRDKHGIDTSSTDLLDILSR